MNKRQKAKLILVEIESLNDSTDLNVQLTMLNEIVKDAKELADAIEAEEIDQAA